MRDANLALAMKKMLALKESERDVFRLKEIEMPAAVERGRGGRGGGGAADEVEELVHENKRLNALLADVQPSLSHWPQAQKAERRLVPEDERERQTERAREREREMDDRISGGGSVGGYRGKHDVGHGEQWRRERSEGSGRGSRESEEEELQGAHSPRSTSRGSRSGASWQGSGSPAPSYSTSSLRSFASQSPSQHATVSAAGHAHLPLP